jgi:hypothetical protein
LKFKKLNQLILRFSKSMQGKGFELLAGVQGFCPRFDTPKNIWEDSPDEGGDSVTTTAVNRTVTKTARQKPYSILLGAHLSLRLLSLYKLLSSSLNTSENIGLSKLQKRAYPV